MPWSRLRSGLRWLVPWFGPLQGAEAQHDPVVARLPQHDERFLRELADSIDQVLLLWDLRAREPLYVSPALERLTGVVPGNLTSLVSRLAGLVHPADRDRLRGKIEALRDDETFETEFRIHRPDGAECWIQVRGFPVRNSFGEVRRRAILAADITVDRQVREQLRVERESFEARIHERAIELDRLLDAARRNETRFNEAQHIARIGSWELDLVTHKLLWSDEIFRIFEIDPYAFGASYEAFLETIHPDDRDVVNRAYTESVRSRVPYEIVHRLRMRDGRVKHVRERCETFYADDGRPLRSAGTVQDITAQIQAQQERDQVQGMLRTVMDSSPDWIYVKDREHRFLMVNRSCAAAIGRSPEELIGRPDTDFWPRELCEGDAERGIRGFHDDDRRAFTGQLVHNAEVPALLADGGPRIFDTYKCPLRDASGEIYGVLGYSRDVTERRQVERILRTSTETLEQRVAARTAELDAAREFTETLLDIVGALVVVLDRDGRIVRINRACETVTGYAAAEALGRRIWDFLLLPEERGPVERVFKSLRAGHFPKSFENVWLTRDGERRHIAWSNTVITDAAGAVEYVVGTGVDITDRKTAEVALRASEEMFRQLAENIQETFFLRDLPSGRMVYVSPSYEKIWGRPVSALYDDPADFLKSVHPEDRPMVQADRDRQYTGDGYFNREYRVLRPDGSIRWVWARTFPIRDAGGQVYRMAGLVQDLTEYKRAGQALAESEAMFREVADNISEVFWLVSPDRRTMHYVSPAFEKVWGRPRGDLYANPKVVFDMIHPEDRDRIMAETLPQLRGEFRDVYDQEYRIIRPDGETRWLHIRYHAVRDAGGVVYRIAGVGEDVTERKQLEEMRLRQAQEQRDTLVREVHHRIKNNLQGVVGLLRQHAREHPLTAPPLEMAIARIQSMALVFGLRSHASTERVLLCRMIEAIARSIADLTGAAIVPQVELHGPCPVPVAESEAVPVALILNELVFNAVKHQVGHAGRPPVTIDIHFTERDAMATIVTPAAHLPPGFDFAAGRGLGSGLQLVRSLLPRPAADLVLRDSEAGVVAELTLRPPLIIGLTEAVGMLAANPLTASVAEQMPMSGRS